MKNDKTTFIISNSPLAKEIHEKNTRIYNLINNTDYLKCFRESIMKQEILLNIKSSPYLGDEVKVQEVDYDDLKNLRDFDYVSSNSYVDDNKEVYFTSHTWNGIYAHLQTFKYHTNEKDLKIEDNTRPEYYLQNFIKYTLKIIKERPTMKMRKAFTCVQFLLNNDFNLLEVIKITLQHQVQYYYRLNRTYNNKLDLEVPLNTLMLNLGDNIIEYITLHHPMLHSFVKFKKGYQYDEKQRIHEKQLLNEFFKAALLDDSQTLAKLLGDGYNEGFLIELIKNYILHLLYSPTNQIQREELKEFEEDLENDEKRKEKEKFYTIDYKGISVQLASILLEHLEQHYPLIGDPILVAIKKKNLKKSRWFYKINTHVVKILMESCSINKPYLTEENIKFIKENQFRTLLKTKEDYDQKPDTILDILYNKKNKFIHPNDFIKLQIQENSYLKDYRPFLHLTINRDLLYTVLEGLSLQEEKNLEYLSSLLYDLSYPNETTILKQAIILYSLCFDEDILTTLNFQEVIKNINKDEEMIYKDIINKIVSHKIILINLLKDLITYLPYKFFILENFLDSRGRMYLNADFINIQLYPLAKGFVNFYAFKKMDTKQIYHEVKQTIVKHISDPTIRKNIYNIGFETYEIKEKALRLSFIKNFFIPDFNIKTLLNLSLDLINNTHDDKIQKQNYLLQIIVENIKKKNRTLYVFNLITAYNKTYYSTNNNNVDMTISDNFYELDATCSGLQMFSIMFDNLDFGIQSNLVGTEKVDIYKNFINAYDLYIIKLMKAVEYLMNTCFPNNMVDTSKKVLVINLNEYNALKGNETLILEAFALMDINKSYCALDIFLDMLKIIDKANLTIRKITEILERTLKQEGTGLKDYTWLLCSEEKQVFKYKAIPLNKNEIQSYMIIRSSLKLYFLNKRLSVTPHKMFKDRNFFKDAIMTFFYGSTNYSRKNVIIELILASTKNKVRYKDAIIFATYSDEFFLFYINKTLKDNTLIFNLRNSLIGLGKPITIKNQNLSMTYSAVRYKKIVKELPSFRKDSNNKRIRNKQITYIQKTEEFDHKEFAKGFIPNFIHYIDATIVHYFYDLIKKINSSLQESKFSLPKISCITNHDTFNCNMAPFLQYFIEDCYLTLYKNKPIKWLLDNLPKKYQDYAESLLKRDYKRLDLKTLNPNFLK